MKNRTSLWTPKEMSLTDSIVPLKVIGIGPDVKFVRLGDIVGIGERRMVDFCKPYVEDGVTFHIVHEADLDGVFDE